MLTRKAILLAFVLICLGTTTMARVVTAHAFGDDILTLYLNGQEVTVGTNYTAQLNLITGTNVLAAHLENPQWGGSLMFSLPVSQNHTIISDESWKFSYHRPADLTWTSSEYDDAQWQQVEDYGPINDWVGYSDNRNALSQLVSGGARIIFGPAKNYYRATFDSPEAVENAEFRIRGSNFTAKIWLNGVEIHNTGTSFHECSDAHERMCILRWPHRVSCDVKAGTNVLSIEIEDMVKKGSGAFFKFGLFDGELRDCDFDNFSSISVDDCRNLRTADRTLPIMLSGRHGKLVMSTVEENGWNSSELDDGNWAEATYQTTFDSQYGTGDGLAGAQFVWNAELWFRKSFYLNEDGSVGIVPSHGKAAQKFRVMNTESQSSFFSLHGRHLPKGAAYTSSGLVIQKVGSAHQVRMVGRAIR